MAVHVVLTVLLWLRPHDAAAAGLTSRPVPFPQRVPPDVIVGRAVCGETVWLVNDVPQLIALSLTTHRIVFQGVHGLQKGGISKLPLSF